MTDKHILYASGSILLGLAGLSYYFYQQGKKETTIAKIPNDMGGDVGDSVILKISGDLYTDMNGVNGLGHVNQPYYDLLALSNKDFVRVYNTYNSKYQKETGTLIEMLRSQWTAFQPEFGTLKDSILQRANTLNLK